MSEPLWPTREGVILRRARLARGLSLDEAAAGLAKLSNTRFSATRWSQLEAGYKATKDGPVLQVPTDGRLAQMAFVVGLHPGQLDEAGRHEAAQVLREMHRQRTHSDQATEPPQPATRVRDVAEEAATYFQDEDIPIEERRATAARFLELAAAMLRGEPLPGTPPASRSARQPNDSA